MQCEIEAAGDAGVDKELLQWHSRQTLLLSFLLLLILEAASTSSGSCLYFSQMGRLIFLLLLSSFVNVNALVINLKTQEAQLILQTTFLYYF